MKPGCFGRKWQDLHPVSKIRNRSGNTPTCVFPSNKVSPGPNSFMTSHLG